MWVRRNPWIWWPLGITLICVLCSLGWLENDEWMPIVFGIVAVKAIAVVWRSP